MGAGMTEPAWAQRPPRPTDRPAPHAPSETRLVTRVAARDRPPFYVATSRWEGGAVDEAAGVPGSGDLTLTDGGCHAAAAGSGVGLIWPVSWSAVLVGALTALAIGLLIALVGLALGSQRGGPVRRVEEGPPIGLVFSVGGAFFGYVAGGWVAARIAGRIRSEPAMLHGAIVWLVTIPVLLVLGAMGAVGHVGGWYGGLAAIAPGTAPLSDADMAVAVRNNALATAVALLLGLVGAVIGGWMAWATDALTHYRARDRAPAA